MWLKILVTVSVILNPFAFLFSQPIFSLINEKKPVAQNSIFTEEGDSLLKLKDSLISAFWLTNPNFLPIRDWNIDEPQIEAKAGLIYRINPGQLFNQAGNKILFQKNIEQILPIASITKLMTALVVMENIDLQETAVISEKALAAYGEQGNFLLKEKISVENLLYALLMESSNDAAVALAEKTEEKTGKNFVALMNEKTKELDLTNTSFADPSGFEPANLSTVNDLVQIVIESFNQPFIWQILKTSVIDLSSSDNKIIHHWTNTDQLLNRLPKVIGGKTGYTNEAQGCLVLVVEHSPSEYLITAVLGAPERFLETEKLIQWVEKAYKW